MQNNCHWQYLKQREVVCYERKRWLHELSRLMSNGRRLKPGLMIVVHSSDFTYISNHHSASLSVCFVTRQSAHGIALDKVGLAFQLTVVALELIVFFIDLVVNDLSCAVVD
jgi:hypothetical protein